MNLSAKPSVARRFAPALDLSRGNPKEHSTGAIARWLAHRLLSAARNPPISIVLWNSEEVPSKAPRPSVGRIVLRTRRALFRLLMDPEFQFGELYSSGELEIDGDLLSVLEALYRKYASGDGFVSYLPRWLDRSAFNSLGRARENIHHHYDIGNEFYRLWLDDRMLYTCAYFARAGMTLEDAQLAKMEHVCRKLRLQPGETVVEAGCGWGSLALFMARQHGVKVRAFNISREQIALARERAQKEQLDHLVEFVEDDYRNISGKYDAFVSVGMLEHVGPSRFAEVGEVIDRALKPHGRGLIHTIGRHVPMKTTSWITRRIFPGARPPALSEMMRIFEPRSFAVQDVENLRLHYAETLAHWLARFDAHQDDVRQMFDESLVRAWRLYLAGSLAAFTTGWMQLYQVVFNRVTSNHVTRTREHLYAPAVVDAAPREEPALGKV
ncbi:MAG: class I SAM-dependent methyltransferase [Phycisphaerales bacterium]